MRKDSNIMVVIDNGLLQAGIRQILKDILPENKVAFKSSLQNCLSGKECPGYLIIDTVLLPEPKTYSLEKLKSKNKDGNILLIESDIIEDTVKTYVADTIKKEDDENIVLQKLKYFFSTFEKQNSKSSEQSLSDREKEIVQLVALGKTNKEISDSLFISPHTVITHRKNITSKLGIKTIAGLTVYAVLNGLIEPDEV